MVPDRASNITPVTECEDAFCSRSHKSVAYDRTELARLQAYLVYADFLHAVSVLFGPKFLWQYEAYMERLYDAYGADRKITVRRVRVSIFLHYFCAHAGLILRCWVYDVTGCDEPST
jgi:hypothetical protein